jgi:hypothetical protein
MALQNPATATGDELREAIHQHLRQYPGLTAFAIARALGLPNPDQGGASRVRRQLVKMQGDGEAEGVKGRAAPADPRPVTRWTAT